ncbi:ATP-binding cassette domain-containing protein [Thermogymnomonas acidicola]|uniref:ATP-binding cassette domain-containing protein n=1 Tax=Thermogymnomonas acidicola TaxID=399579 RepID=UPI001396ACA1|nr:ATP-binding cassette domain-containing protein [Thermogymnomonas acidicola]
MSDLAISVRSLRKTYDGIRYAVDGISFDVKRGGEIFGLLGGKNGAGKTTTIRMLTTLIKPTSGTIEVLGLDPQREPPGGEEEDRGGCAAVRIDRLHNG